jgi:hypothetical protein
VIGGHPLFGYDIDPPGGRLLVNTAEAKAREPNIAGWIDPRIYLTLNHFRRSENPQQSTGLPWQ